MQDNVSLPDSDEIDEQLVWRMARSLLSKLSRPVQVAIYHCAIVHWFDASLLTETWGSGRLQSVVDEPITESDIPFSEDLYQALQRFNFVERLPTDRLALHTLMRRTLLKQLREHEPEYCIEVSARIASYLEELLTNGRTDPAYAIEYAYHLLVADEAKGIEAIDRIMEQFIATGQTASMQALVRVVGELVSEGRLSEYGRVRALGWAQNVTLLSGDYNTAREVSEQILSVGPSAPPKLRGDGFMVLGQVALRSENFQDAEQHFRDALKIYQGAGFVQDIERVQRLYSSMKMKSRHTGYSLDSTKLKRMYELMVVLIPDIPEDRMSNTLDRIAGYITNQGGMITDLVATQPWGRRKLAYPIDHHHDGFYAIYHLKLEPSSVCDVERDLGLDRDVMRHLIVTHTPPKPRLTKHHPSKPTGADDD